MKLKILIFVLFLSLFCLIGVLFFMGPTVSLIERQKETETDIFREEENSQQKQTTEAELKERVGQMLMVGFRGTEITPDSAVVKAIRELNLGAVVLFDFDVASKSFPRNIVDYLQTKKLIADLKSVSPSLIVAVDVEGGAVNRLKPEYGFLPLSSAKSLGALGMEEAEQEIRAKAREMSQLGFNMNLAPVVDLNLNPNNPIIGSLGRSFSGDPQIVNRYSGLFISTFENEAIIPVAKHFPGHGSSSQDSHLGIVDITDAWKEAELVPYQKLNDKGVLKAIMTAHVFNKNIDPDYPATLSPVFLNDVLRNQIGFRGVIISDDMQMGAIINHYSLEEAIVRAVNAGCDILSFSNNSFSGYDEEIAYRAVEIILKAVEDNRISKERIIEASNRIFELKKEFGIIEPGL